METLIRELGLSEHVALPGFVSNPYSFMRKAAALVLSSRYEALPTVLIEAMALGTPFGGYGLSLRPPGDPRGRAVGPAGERGR